MGLNDPENTKFCILPFSSLVIVGNGRVSTCSAAWDVLTPIGEGAIQGAWGSERLEEVRESFRRDEFPNNCRNCKMKESAGFRSKRMYSNESYRNRFQIWQDDWREYVDELMALETPELTELDLSFSKKCNLTCAMCSSEFSSSWVKPDREFFREYSESFRDEVRPHVKLTEAHKNIVDELLSIVGNLSQLKIKGGEPLADELCLQFLSKLHQTKFSGKVWLVTNGTRADERTMKILETVPNLNISLSVDGVGEIYEWIRGYSFSNLEENVARYLLLPNLVHLGAAFTASAWNIVHIPKFLKWDRKLREVTEKFIGTHFLQHVYQPYMRAENLSMELRSRVAAEIRKELSETYSPIGIENILTILGKPQFEFEIRRQFGVWTNYMNRLREKNISDILPELNREIPPEANQSLDDTFVSPSPQ